jgi:glycosyltransferase involved in cell wall biosynthesis
MKPVSLAVIVSHPVPYFAPWYREIARDDRVRLRVFFCCDWGVRPYVDSDFHSEIKWDVPLLEGYDHEFLPIRKRPTHLTFTSVNNQQVSKRLSSFGPDVVQGYGYAYSTLWKAWLWARRTDTPFLIYSDSVLSHRSSSRTGFLRDSLVRLFYQHVDGAFAVGDQNVSFHRHYGVPVERIWRGSLPVDQKRFQKDKENTVLNRQSIRQRYSIPTEAFVVICSGKLIPRKRPMDLVEASILGDWTDRGIWLMFVGDGPERAALQSRIDSKELSNVVLTGFINQAEIPAHFQAADVLAVCSSRDPHPLVVTEAASFGLPIVASDAIGCIGESDTAQIGVNATAYPCGSVSDLRIAVENLATNQGTWNSMSEASRRIASSQDASVAAAALIDAVQSLSLLGRK